MSLSSPRSQNRPFCGEVEELGRRHDDIMGRVERLHTEKHKLEDRLNVSSRAAGTGGEGRIK